MLREALSAPALVAGQLAQDAGPYAALGAVLRGYGNGPVLTIARGSSDHAAHYLAYLVMARLGRIVTSLPMSIVTLYHAHIAAPDRIVFAFSQSGQSPDLVGPVHYFASHGACTACFVNATDSPLAQVSGWTFGLHAGPERSVAATKSFIAQLVAGARVVCNWHTDAELSRALLDLPAVLERAARQDWGAAVDALVGAERLLVIGRGTGLPVALEAALKFKETCGIQAEAFSGAEVRHGPLALVDRGYPVLVFAPRGPAQAGLLALAQDLRARGARVLLAAPPGTPGANLPLEDTGSEDLDPVAVIQSFYPMVEALSRARGRNPDHPPHLAKVTRTE